MHAFRVAEELAAHPVDVRQLPPAAQAAADRPPGGDPAKAVFRVQVLERGARGRDVAAVAVQEVEAVETATRKRAHIVLDEGHQGARAGGDRAREGEVELSGAELDRRSEE